MTTDIGSAIPITSVTDRQVEVGPAIPVYAVPDGHEIDTGSAVPVYEVDDNHPRVVGNALPVALVTDRSVIAGPAVPVYIVNGDAISYASKLFDQGSLDTFDVIDATPTVRITPRLLWNNEWGWWAIKSQRYAGKMPHFLLAKAAKWGTFTGELLGCWATSLDTDTWHYFDHQNVGVVDIELYHNSAFPDGVIYVSQLPLYPFARTQRKVAEWALDAKVSETISTTNKILGTATPRDTGDGRLAPALPFYGFKISSGGTNPKNKCILTTGNHAPETPGRFAFEAAIDWLLALGSEAKFLLDWWDFYVYPCLNPQGVWAGWFGGNPQHASQHNDLTAGFEDLDAISAAIDVDTSGSVAVGIDFHTYWSTGTSKGVVYDNTDALHVAFANAYKVYDPSFALIKDTTATLISRHWANTLGAVLTPTVEQCAGKTNTIISYKSSGQWTMRALTQLHAQGRFTNGPGVGSRVFGAVASNRIVWSTSYTFAANNPMSMAFWFYRTAANTNMVLLEIANAAGTRGMYAWSPSPATLAFTVEGTAGMYRRTLAAFDLNTWIHIVVTYDGGTLSTGVHAYRNGIELTYDAGANGSGLGFPFDGNVIVGNYHTNNAASKGNLAQAALWNRIITPAEITNLAAAQAPNLAASSGLKFYFKGNTSDLHDVISNNLGVVTGTSQITGVGNGPNIYYP